MTRRLHGCRCAAATLREVGGEGEATAKNCYDTGMSLPFDGKRLRAYEFELGAGGQRLGCKFMLDDESIQFISEAEITPEIETLIASLGPQTSGLTNRPPVAISH
jgi:hypothetical protein